MDKSQWRRRLLKKLAIAPELKTILVSADPLDAKRARVRRYLARLLSSLFEDDPTIPSLEWILARDANRVFRNLLSQRNERLAGFSFLKYLDDLLHRGGTGDPTPPSAGFFAEVEHLLKGITGTAGLYPSRPPTFLDREGAAAARLRSTDLSRMGRAALRIMDHYPSGLAAAAVRRRSRNKARIMAHFGAGERDWQRWQWHTRHIIRDADVLARLVDLTEDEFEAVRLARCNRIPFGITPYYLSLLDRSPHRRNDYAVRAQVIPSLHYVRRLCEQRGRGGASIDFMLERDTSPIEGITRRYPMIVILKPIVTCPQICVYCQRNWEIEEVCSPRAALSWAKIEKAVAWIARRPEIREVLVTGGDPLLLANARIERILQRLARIEHVQRIRIGTRTPVTLPQRISASLVRGIARFHQPGRREVLIVTHFEHPYEITPEAVEAVQRFRRAGMEVYNQLVYTFFVSKRFEAAALRQQLHLAGVTPYYTFNTKGKDETDDFRVPIARLMQENKEEARLLPGSVRTDFVVFNVPRLGKNSLTERQHHDVISILPTGRRVYEFHPWEKKMALVDTYVHTDVSIYTYLQRLRASGEDPQRYRSIWYYY